MNGGGKGGDRGRKAWVVAAEGKAIFFFFWSQVLISLVSALGIRQGANEGNGHADWSGRGGKCGKSSCLVKLSLTLFPPPPGRSHGGGRTGRRAGEGNGRKVPQSQHGSRWP